MKKVLFLIAVLFIIGQSSCKKSAVSAADKSGFLNGTFKAKEVKEGSTVVYRDGVSGNIVPGYSKYRVAFSVTTTGRRTVKLIEYTGETFDGTWSYDSGTDVLTLSNLLPRPAAGNLVFKVETLETGRLVMSNTQPNLKTGETINRYTLITE